MTQNIDWAQTPPWRRDLFRDVEKLRYYEAVLQARAASGEPVTPAFCKLAGDFLNQVWPKLQAGAQ